MRRPQAYGAAQRADVLENVLSGRKPAAEMARLYKVSEATISRIISVGRRGCSLTNTHEFMPPLGWPSKDERGVSLEDIENIEKLVDATGRAEEPPERSSADPISSSLTVGIEVLSSVIKALRR